MPGGIAVLLAVSLLLPSAGGLPLPAPTVVPRAFTAHAPISIEGSAQFIPANGVVGGNGTPTDPFLIGNWDIDGSSADGIRIANTSAAFRVFNVSVHGTTWSTAGVRFFNVSGGAIQDIVVTGGDGVFVKQARNVTVERCDVSGDKGFGFIVLDSQAVNVTDSRSASEGSGISYQNVTRGVVARNWLRPFEYDGVSIFSSSWIEVQNNSIEHAYPYWGMDGIHVESSTNLTLLDNTITAVEVGGQWGYGIHLLASTYVDLERNSLWNRGVLIESWLESWAYHGNPRHFDTHRISPSNRVNDLPILFYKDLRGGNFSPTLAGEIILVNATDVNITSHAFVDTEVGILLAFPRHVSVRDNDFSRVKWAVFATFAEGLTLYRNNFDRVGVSTSGDDVGWNAPYPVGGNYWSDYGGYDRCSGPDQIICPDPDGFGDIPEVADELPAMAWIDHLAQAPTACFQVEDSSPIVGRGVGFNATCASDPDVAGVPLELRWDWNGDGRWDTNWTTDPTASHRFTKANMYLVQLEVRDASGLLSIARRGVAVAALPPGGFLVDWGLPLLLVVALVAAITYLGTSRRQRAGSRSPPSPTQPFTVIEYERLENEEFRARERRILEEERRR